MPNTRMLLWIALAAILYLNYEAWMHDYPVSAQRDTAVNPPPALPAVPALSATRCRRPRAAPPRNSSDGAHAAAPAATEALRRHRAGTASAPDDSPSQPVHVTTDVFDGVINLKGGELDQADLKQYPLRKDTPNIPVRLLSREPPASLYYCRPVSSAAAAKPRRRISRHGVRPGNLRASRGRQGTAVPLTWNRWPGTDRDQDLRFHARPVFIDLIYDVQNAGPRRRKLSVVFAILAPLGACIALLFRRRNLFVQGPASMTHEIPRSERGERDRHKFSETITNGWLASRSINSCRRSCRPRSALPVPVAGPPRNTC